MADVAVPVGDRGDDTAGPVLAGHRVLVGQAAGPMGRSPGTAGDHLPGSVSWSKILDDTSPDAPSSPHREDTPLIAEPGDQDRRLVRARLARRRHLRFCGHTATTPSIPSIRPGSLPRRSASLWPALLE
jgi:hypothetical protein